MGRHEELAARLDFLSAAVQALAFAMPPSLARTAATALSASAEGMVRATPSLDEAVSAELVPLLRALQR